MPVRIPDQRTEGVEPPEYAHLTDLRNQRADGDWKALRKAKATSALKTLARIAPSRRSHFVARPAPLT